MTAVRHAVLPSGRTLCGRLAPGAVATTWDQVTCRSCRRYAGAADLERITP